MQSKFDKAAAGVLESVLRAWLTSGLHLGYTWPTQFTPGLHMVYTWLTGFTFGLHLDYTWLPRGLHLVYTWFTPGSLTIYGASGAISAGRGEND